MSDFDDDGTVKAEDNDEDGVPGDPGEREAVPKGASGKPADGPRIRVETASEEAKTGRECGKKKKAQVDKDTVFVEAGLANAGAWLQDTERGMNCNYEDSKV